MNSLQDFNLKFQVIAFSLYFGFKKSIWKGYYPIVRQIYKILKKFLKDRGDQIKFPVDINAIRLEYLQYESHANAERAYAKISKLFKVCGNEQLRQAMNITSKNMSNTTLTE
mmetsp:Transcript_38130/g.34085  ORF Transcript_38130/g.34085 Transcript_38130/m.34085 type:complete len:112 (+) Transcript_38130:2-337(+)